MLRAYYYTKTIRSTIRTSLSSEQTLDETKPAQLVYRVLTRVKIELVHKFTIELWFNFFFGKKLVQFVSGF